MIRSIPTGYKGIRFRSRLEAKWAAFFDLLEWEWEYEPVDFNGWIPDFALYGADIIYVEVKPVRFAPRDVFEKIDRSGCEKEVLVVGQTGTMKWGPDALQIGWLREGEPDYQWWWQDAIYGRWSGSESKAKNPNGIIGFCPEMGSWKDRITGCYDGGCFGDKRLYLDEIITFWGKAANRTQWSPPDIPGDWQSSAGAIT